MTDCLVMFSVGPVQTFISQARKTQDLYNGSFMISELSRHALSSFESKGARPIYPDKNPPSIPNLLVLRVTGRTSEEAGNLCKEIEESTRTKLVSWYRTALKGAQQRAQDYDDQVRALLDIHWACKETDQSYGSSYSFTSQLLGASKATRRFDQLAETGTKCSICGERNAMVHRSRKSDIRNDTPSQLNLSYLMKRGERLCSVCFMKREGGFLQEYERHDSDFPSVSEVALMDILAHIEASGKRVLVDNFMDCFEGRFDWELLYPTSLTKKYLEKNDYKLTESLSDTRERNKKIIDFLEESGTAMTNYYSVLMYDGDGMGQWVSGKFLDDMGQLEQFQRYLTENLSTHSEELDGLIAKPKGRVIYAGGDDVLTFANLRNTLGVMQEIYQTFRTFADSHKMGKFASQERMTISGATCIAHRMIPLSEVMQMTRHLEKKAKESPGKNSFVLAVMKRSGEVRYAIQKWMTNNSPTLELTGRILSDFSEKRFSPTYMRTISQTLQALRFKPNDTAPESDMMNSEIERLVARSCLIKRGDSESDESFKKRKATEIEKTSETLNALYKCSSVMNFMELVDICLFLGKEGVT